MAHIVIIGNGIAGITCARHIRKCADHQITVISGESDYFFARTALMYVYMGHLKLEHTKPYEDWFWKKNRIALRKAWVTKISATSKKVQLDTGDQLTFDKLVIATGSKPKRLRIPGEELPGVQGLYSLQDLELLEKNTHKPGTTNQRVKQAVIVGGGLIGVELAEMLKTRGIEVTFLVKEDRFWGRVLPEEEAKMIERHLQQRGVRIRFNTELREVKADDNGRAGSVVTNEGEEIPCQFVGMTIGVEPNIDWLRNGDVALDKGVLVNAFLETAQNDIYAIGDCAEFVEPKADVNALNQVWYTGRMMGETLAQTLVGKRMAYQPGPWFNSAKFFDLEYQTYGQVTPAEKEGVSTFYWQDEHDKRMLKVQFETKSFKLLGINLLGIRMRHEKFDIWLRSEASVLEVLADLNDASFDPEFFKSIKRDVLDKWNSTFPNHRLDSKKRFSLF